MILPNSPTKGGWINLSLVAYHEESGGFIVARTIGEEKMLVAQLEGYADYKTKVKYRLLPLVW